MAENSPHNEPPVSRESVQFQPNLVGLKTRLLLGGEALSPNKVDIPPITREGLGSLEERNYDVFNNASTGERKDHWRGKEGDVFDRQKAAWIHSTVATFTNEQAQRFFQSEKGRQWSEIFSRLGINTQGFNQQTAEQLYATYFTDGKSDIKKFVKDCIEKNATQDPSAIQWLANIFGKQSSEIVAQLIDAEKKLKDHPDQLVEEANREETVDGQQVKRVNNLHEEREKRPLRFLASHVAPQQPMQPDGRENQVRVDTQPGNTNRIQNPAATEEQHLSPEQIADSLIDYTTGEVRDVHIDLSATVTDLVDKALTVLETEHARLDPENMVLSDIARIMIDKLNTQANSMSRELAFAIQGVALEKNGKRLFVATHIVPTMSHTEARVANVDVKPEVFMKNSVKLAQNTNLENLFFQLRQPSNGAQGGVCHIHHIGLGQGWTARPSQGDKDQVKSFLEQGYNPYRWGVITKTQDGQLHYNLIRSTRNTDGTVSEEPIRINDLTAAAAPAVPEKRDIEPTDIQQTRTEPAQQFAVEKEQFGDALKALEPIAKKYTKEKADYEEIASYGSAVLNDTGAVPPDVNDAVAPLLQVLQAIPGIVLSQSSREDLEYNRRNMHATNEEFYAQLFRRNGLRAIIRFPNEKDQTTHVTLERALKRKSLNIELSFSEGLDLQGGQIIINEEARGNRRIQGSIEFDQEGKVIKISNNVQRVYGRLQYIDVRGILQKISDPSQADADLNTRNIINS